MHAAGGVIRGEPAGIILCGPAPSGLVVVAELLTLPQESIVESLPIGATKPRRVDECGKKCVGRHWTQVYEETSTLWHVALAPGGGRSRELRHLAQLFTGFGWAGFGA